MQVHREATGALTERAMRLYVNPVLGDLPLAAVRPFHVQQLVKQLCDELAPTTVHVTYGYVASVFKSAVRDRLIARTPCEGIRLPAIPRREMFIPEPSSVLDVADLLPRYYRAAPLTAAQSGLRPSEVFGLEVECVDFLRRTIRVRQQLVTSIEPGNIAYLGEPKTPHSDRTVPVTAATVDTLAAHLADFPAREVEVEDRPTRATRNAALPAWSSRPRVASRSSGQAGAARGCLRLARRDSRPALACTAAVTCTRRH